MVGGGTVVQVNCASEAYLACLAKARISLLTGSHPVLITIDGMILHNYSLFLDK